MTSARRYQVVQRLVGRPATVIAAAVVLAFIVIALGAAHLAPFDPTTTDFAAVRKAPSAVHLLGTDEVGRDVLSRLIWGARASLLAGVIPVTLAVSLSIPLGLLSGYTGGWLDSWMMRLNDAILMVREMVKQKRGGSLIYMGSVHSKEASPLKAAYVAAKHGLLGLCRAAAKGLQRFPLIGREIVVEFGVHAASKNRGFRAC